MSEQDANVEKTIGKTIGFCLTQEIQETDPLKKKKALNFVS